MNQRIIYKITCSPTGWVYVGSTKNPGSRWSSHKSDLRRGKHANPSLQGDWDRYGSNSFTFRCVEIEDQNEDMEAVIIAAHRGYCYNVVKKAQGLSDMKLDGDIPEDLQDIIHDPSEYLGYDEDEDFVGQAFDMIED